MHGRGLVALLTCVALSFGAAACGGDDTSGGAAELQGTTDKKIATETAPSGAPSTPSTSSSSSSSSGGSAAASAQGKKIFTDNCSSCHTFKDANASGKIGPDLDQLKPDAATVERQVTNGGGAMPAFKGQLTPAQIKAVSQYVATAASGGG